jgi:hypothetical protein
MTDINKKFNLHIAELECKQAEYNYEFTKSQVLKGNTEAEPYLKLYAELYKKKAEILEKELEKNTIFLKK